MTQGISPGLPARRVRPLQPRRGLVDDVYDALLEQLMDQVIEPGSRASIDGLARDLNVSPTPVREALTRLEAEGLVVKVPLKGYTAAELIGDDGLRDLYEMRRLLEPAAAGRAAGRLSENALTELAEHARAMHESAVATTGRGDQFETYRDFADHDAAFHRLIADGCGNQLLADAVVRLRPHMHLYRLFFKHGLAIETSDEHAAILRALRKASARDAEIAMREHLERSYSRMTGRD